MTGANEQQQQQQQQPSTARRQRFAFAAVLLAVAAARLLFLSADPPATMPDADVMDEGLWASAARHRVLFGDWFADDSGNGHLIAPLYSWLLVAIYSVFGVGLWQTRLLAALSSIACAWIGGRWIAARRGWPAGSLTVALMGLCPLLDQHGRFALIESSQACALLASFALLFAQRRSVARAAAGGAMLGAAFLIKPNSAAFGGAPFALAFALLWLETVREHGRARHREFTAQAIAAVLAGLGVVAAIGLPIWLAHWSEFTATVQFESGSVNWDLGTHLLRLGLIGSRATDSGQHLQWSLLRHAATCTVAVWLLLLRRAGGRPRADMADEASLWCWVLTSLLMAELGYDHATRRQVLFTPALAMLAAHCWSSRRAEPVATRAWSPFASWCLLTAPLLVLAKPKFANAAAFWFESIGVDAAHGTASCLGGAVAVAGLATVPAMLTLLRWRCEPWLLRLDRHGHWLLAALLALEAMRLGALPPHEYTIRAAQRELAALVQPGEIVLGEHAATLLQETNVRTVRRVLAGRHYSSPRPNPDAAARLHPRYVLDYTEPAIRELADVTAVGYRRIRRVGLLREPAGDYRYELELWERQ